MTNAITYKTVLSSLKKGERPCYRAVANHTGTVYMSDIVDNVAITAGVDPAVMKFYAELFVLQIRKSIMDGKHVEIENLFSSGVAVRGTFAGMNAPWDKSKNSLIPYFYAKGSMRTAFDNVATVNVTEGNHAQIKRVLDTVAKVEGMITNQPNVTVYLSGVNLLVNSAAADEGVWLEGKDGAIIANATVTASTATTIDCEFATLPEDGEYKIVVATRGGLGPGFGVSIARKNVVVKSAN